MTGGEDFIKNAKCLHRHRSAMSNSGWCDSNKSCTVLKLHDMCHNPKCKCQKQITFTSNQFQLEGNGCKNTMKKIFKGSQTAWNNFLKPALKIATPIVSAGVAMNTKSPQSAQVTSIIIKSLKGRDILSLTDMHCNGLRLKVMWNHFKDSVLSKWIKI